MVRRGKRKKIISIIVLIISLISITIGYSALNATLNIRGTTNIVKPNWDIHFTNIQVTDGSVTATSGPTIASGGLKITYSVTLPQPGDFYEFTVDVINAGSIAAKLSAAPTLTGVDNARDVYLNYTFTHSDDSAVVVNEVISGNSSKTYKVRIEYDNNISPSQLPTSNQSLILTVGMNFVQN